MTRGREQAHEYTFNAGTPHEAHVVSFERKVGDDRDGAVSDRERGSDERRAAWYGPSSLTLRERPRMASRQGRRRSKLASRRSWGPREARGGPDAGVRFRNV